MISYLLLALQIGPTMVVVPGGTFTMGSTAEERTWAASHGSSPGSVADEAPQHTVTLHAFALGKFDVTRDEYAEFMRDTKMQITPGCGHDGYRWYIDTALAWDHPGIEQSGRDPVVCVSWYDAQAYIAWLNQKTHGGYRLPTEAEWEYAARGGTQTMFSWGVDTSGAFDHAWFKSNSAGQTHPVGSKRPNAFGLYDMVGLVWQWTADCYAETYATTPAIGCMRVDRGGSWSFPAWFLRPTTRERNPGDFRDRIMGFRVAKTLP